MTTALLDQQEGIGNPVLRERAREDDRLEKYPRLPVLQCPGFAERGLSTPETASAPQQV